jgi:hypothetical protein
MSLKPETKPLITAALTRHGMKESDVGYLRLRSRTGSMTVLVHAMNGTILEIVPIRS